MSINLSKGQRINLSKENPSLKKVRIGLGWDANRFDTGKEFDLDASVFICKADGDGRPKLISDQHFIFYNQPKSPDGAVAHTGDHRTGSASGDDETIHIDLTSLSAEVDELSFIVTIHEALDRNQNFGQVDNSYIKLYDDETGAELYKYALADDFSIATSVQFGSLYKKDGNWVFHPIGEGFKRGLADFVVAYGGNLA